MNVYRAAQGFEKVKSSLMRGSMIYISDSKEVLIENCLEIMEFSENCVKVSLKKCIVSVTGLDLAMRNFNNSSVSISGKIHSVDFIEKDKLC